MKLWAQFLVRPIKEFFHQSSLGIPCIFPFQFKSHMWHALFSSIFSHSQEGSQSSRILRETHAIKGNLRVNSLLISVPLFNISRILIWVSWKPFIYRRIFPSIIRLISIYVSALMSGFLALFCQQFIVLLCWRSFVGDLMPEIFCRALFCRVSHLRYRCVVK